MIPHVIGFGMKQNILFILSVNFYVMNLPVDVALPILLHRKDRGQLWLICTALRDLQNVEYS